MNWTNCLSQVFGCKRELAPVDHEIFDLGAPLRKSQFLCLGTYLRSSSGSNAEDVARRAHQAWAALSRAAHFHPYELLPTREELLAWDEVVMEAVEATEKEWR